jgi:flagellar biosynthesis anti-sigma factor FlgM
MRIPSRVYKSPDPVQAERIAKSGDAKKVEGGRDAGQAKRVDPDVRVNVSEQARALANQNGIDVSKVERLRSAIEKGDFKIDAQKIANRIVDGG